MVEGFFPKNLQFEPPYPLEIGTREYMFIVICLFVPGDWKVWKCKKHVNLNVFWKPKEVNYFVYIFVCCRKSSSMWLIKLLVWE